MKVRLMVGLLLLAYALGNIVYDAMVDKAMMGVPAILVTALAAALGGVLIGQSRSATMSRS